MYGPTNKIRFIRIYGQTALILMLLWVEVCEASKVGICEVEGAPQSIHCGLLLWAPQAGRSELEVGGK